MFRRRTGVFVCHCGNNIGGVVNVPEVVEYARELENVVHAEENLYSCSEDGIASLKAAIGEHKLNRVVVAACTPRTHDWVFKNACQEAGLNRSLFEFVNIREHCSWIHSNMPDQATEKAKILIKMGVSKANLLEPLNEIEVSVIPAALVIGGGISGMTAALSLADQGFQVHLVERAEELGGLLLSVDRLFPTGQEASDLLRPLIEGVRSHPRINLHLNSEVKEVSGFVGNFEVGLSRDGQEPMPGDSVIVGTIIVATGARELKPVGEYGYGRLDGVVTQLELEESLPALGSRPSAFDSVVMINCVGARVAERSYCGRFCCLTAMKNACLIKEANQAGKVYILQRDVMAYGTDFERYYRRAMEAGVRFIRYSPDRLPEVIGRERVEAVKVYHQLAGKEMVLPASLLVLTPPLVPQEEADVLSKMLKVPLGSEGFFLEAHLKLRPVEFAADGIYLCGSGRYPAEVSECVAQAYAAAAKAAGPMSSGELKVEAITAICNESRCSGCGSCVEVCPFGAVELRETGVGKKAAQVNEVKCKGCGTCVAACPSGALQQRGFTDQQLLAMVDALVGRV